MFLVKVILRPSPIQGLGCFAAERISKHQKVWEFDPRIDLRIMYDTLAGLPVAAREFVDRYGYVHMVNGDKVMTLCGDFARHMNHASSPNTAAFGDHNINLATRDIEEGEEITCNYFSFDLEADNKLEDSE